MIDVRIYDIVTRHQLYLEGCKVWKAREFNAVMVQLTAELRRLLGRTNVGTLGQLSRMQLNKLLTELNGIQKELYNPYVNELMKFLREFLTVDNGVVSTLYESKFELTPRAAARENDTDPLFGLPAAFGTKDGLDRFFSTIKNTPIAGNGMLPAALLAFFAAGASAKVANLIRKGYANNQRVDDALADIIGTKAANFRDGALNGINSQASAVISTIMQHATALNQVSIASLYSRRYRWLSILDSGTTQICRSLNGKIFIYGQGPLPPQHINCRSSTVPLIGNDDDDGPVPNTFAEWFKAQPKSVQNDIGILAGRPRTLIISLREFASKTDLMLAR